MPVLTAAQALTLFALCSAGLLLLFLLRQRARRVVLRDRAKVGELPGGTNDQAVYAMIAGQA